MITADLVPLLSGELDLQMGTRDQSLKPHSARVSAVRVEADAEHLEAFVPTLGADAVLRDLEANGQVALFAGHPPDFRAYQLKGTFAGSRPARPDEREFVEQYWTSYLEALSVIGFDRATFAHWPTWPAVVVRIRVNAVFSQTPGPGTGAPLP